MSSKPQNPHLPQQGTRTLPATLRDVAELAGVSTKTVSRVVNHQGEISEATRERVQATIDQLGYRPNILARSLIHKRSNTLAVVAWGIDYFGPLRVVVGIEQQAHELGYSLFLNLLDQPGDSSPEQVLDSLIAHRVDGIIWAVPEMGDNRAWLKSTHLADLPPIIFMTMEARPGIAAVAIDNRDGGKQATQHLIDQGRRKIGIITGPMSWWEARERFEGWRDALLQAGISPSPSLVVEGEWAATSGEQGMRTLLAQEPEIDAVFASSDQIALGALGTAYRFGLRVPQDLAIVGFDNIPDSACFWPPLTTIYQQLIDAGRISVQQLHKMIEAYRQYANVGDLTVTMIKPQLIVRSSSL
jgi:LacI family transcriptional regulator